jgi:hypothetical protein
MHTLTEGNLKLVSTGDAAWLTRLLFYNLGISNLQGKWYWEVKSRL